jgi:hypothetical protein
MELSDWVIGTITGAGFLSAALIFLVASIIFAISVGPILFVVSLIGFIAFLGISALIGRFI